MNQLTQARCEFYMQLLEVGFTPKEANDIIYGSDKENCDYTEGTYTNVRLTLSIGYLC